MKEKKSDENSDEKKNEAWHIPGVDGLKIPDVRNLKEYIRFWIKLFPASKKDYFLFILTIVDLILMEINNSYKVFLPGYFVTGVFVFDFLVILIWVLDFRKRYKRHENKLEYIQINWYEIVGMLPFSLLRPFLLLRAVKMGIAAFKLANSNIDPNKLKTREVYLKFSDVIMDTISDNVFLQSIDRVRDVMRRLEYDQLVDKIYSDYESEIKDSVKDVLYSKTSMKDLAKLPLFSVIENKVTGEISESMRDILKSKIMADVIRTITTEILDQMEKRVTMLDVERITKREFSLSGDIASDSNHSDDVEKDSEKVKKGGNIDE